ncbi:hypothetical protein [Bremerella sp. P1]|uniref:hypothetical protein n=1 Tax=Bremerella sp. P1 TaxID=3026424 RepID=UPI002367F15C|nr:hypothetical protein [Bremerella sp. P1]WDI42100.1 hypothetical protein PSR63_26970 [Bremerella sp. P1]
MTRKLLVTVLITVMLLPSTLFAAPDISNKVVLANLDRYPATVRLGETRREIKPGKASLLSPKSYPVTIEVWSGNTKEGWRKETITKAGKYAFNFKRGSWSLTELKKSTTPTISSPSSPKVVRQQIIQRPARRLPINADRNRWSPLARAVYGAGRIYQFVRDERDRDLLRELLIRAREDEDWDRLEKWLKDEPIPELYKKDIREGFDDLAKLSDADWKEIETADEKDWDQAKADLGDLISEDEWENVTGDFAEIDNEEFWQDDVDVDLGDLDYTEDLDFEDVDLGDLDGNDSFDIDGLDFAEDFDVGDFEIDNDSYDLGDFDDFGGYDGSFDVDVGDFGGGYFGDDDFGDFGGDDFDFDFGGDDFGSFDDF